MDNLKHMEAMRRQDPGAPTIPKPSSAAVGRNKASVDALLLRQLLRSIGDPPIEFELPWSGEHVTSATAARGHVRLKDRRTLFGLLRNPQVYFGDAYSRGRIEIKDDLTAFMTALFEIFSSPGPRSLTTRIADWMRVPRRNTLAGSRDNIHKHYDIGNEFYSLWLGETMAYTCAYYPTLQTSLDEAQTAKMDHVCRKLRLSSTDTVIEAGCGWGSLALHMARRYGAKVRAFNISNEQIEFARRRAHDEGLDGRVEFIADDYRNITGSCTVFASVGMLEHVGRGHYPELGRVAQRAMVADGRGLIHSIGRNQPAPLDAWIERRIFPGAYAPSIGEMMQIFEPENLSVIDVENIRLHYARTLRDWLERYEGAIDTVRAMFDEDFVRMWRLYLAGSIAAFETGTLQLFQVLFTKSGNNALPWTREYMYPR